MQTEIFYEKYRPSQLAHVIGQNSVVNVLRRSCERNMFHHSYLLCGKYGTGKTSVARIIATIFTCMNRKDGSSQVCGTCDACRTIRAGTAVDVIEVDGAANSKIENTRSIIESSRYAPQVFKKRIFIIDECHRLSKAAMTSLLKTLEEPSSTSVFILCTTEFESVPKEIVSRCQRLNFRPVSSSVISTFLVRLFNARKVAFDQLAIDMIATACRGSVRDSLEMSQEAIIFSDGKVTPEKVAELVGSIGRQDLYDIVRAISTNNVIGAFNIVESAFISGIDSRTLLSELSDVLRSIMLSNISADYINDVPISEKEFVETVKKSFQTNKLAECIEIFEEAGRSLNINLNNRWVVEAAMIKIFEKLKE